jgi:hypothetical protein
MEKLPLRQAISSAQFLCEMPHFMRIGGGSGQLLASSLSRQTVTHELVSKSLV